MPTANQASRPLLGLACALAAGAHFGGAGGRTAAAVLLASSALLLGFALLSRGAGTLAALATAAAGIAAADSVCERLAYERAPLHQWIQQGDPHEPVRIEGRLVRDAWRDGDRVALVLDVLRVRVGRDVRSLSGRARLAVGGQNATLELGEGEHVAIWSTLRAPRGFATPGAFDSVAHAFGEGVHATGFCKSPLLIERQAGPSRHSLPLLMSRIRQWARRMLIRSLPPGPEEGVVRAMVLGDRTAVDPETAEALRIAGTYHVIAISGAQVALIAALLLYGLKRTRAGPLSTALVLTAAVWSYAAFVGGDLPVQRAALTASVLFLGRALELDSDPVNLLGLAAGLLLIDRPSSIADVSFQLSFGATLGILLLAQPLVSFLGRGPLWLRWSLASSLAAQAALLPLLAFHFHRLAPAAVVLNLVAVPLASAVLVLGFAFLAVAPAVPSLGAWLATAAWAAAHFLLRSGGSVREIDALDVRVASPAAWAVGVYLVGLALLATRRRMRAGLFALACGAASFVAGPVVVPADGRLHVALLDVGQGDSLVLTSPAGRTLIVDAGVGSEAASQETGPHKRFDAGEAIVAPYLWRKGTTHVGSLLLTHAHPDHVGGAPFIVRTFGVREILEGIAPRRDPTYAGLVAALDSAPASRRAVRGGMRWEWDGVAIEVLSPLPAGPGPPRTRNDDSIVLLLRYGATSFLLTGDVERAAESALDVLHIDVLKVAHHGSRTSTSAAFLERARPGLALISVGHRSPFGHPHAEVLGRLQKAGIRVLRTDHDGTIRLSSDGRRMWLATERSLLSHRIR